MGGGRGGDVARRATVVRTPDRRALRWPGQAGRARQGARRRARPDRARRADQPPRPRSDRVARDAGCRPHGRRSCSSPTTVTCSTGSRPVGARARWSSSTAGRRTCTSPPRGRAPTPTYLDASAARLEREAGAEATRRILARRELAWLRRGAPARSTKPKARLRHAAEIVGGGPGASRRAGERPRARRRHQPARQPGRRARRRVASASAT